MSLILSQKMSHSASLNCCFYFCLSVEAVRVNRIGKGLMLKTVGWGPGELRVSPEDSSFWQFSLLGSAGRHEESLLPHLPGVATSA